MPYVWTNGFRTWYESVGQGLPLVFVHGHTFNRTMWQPQVEAFSSHYRVITYDLRGHGESEVPLSGYSPPSYAGDLLALLDALGIERVALAGNSVGGSTVAAFTVANPERVAALAMVATSVSRPYASEVDAETFRLMKEVTHARGIRVAIEQVWLTASLFAGARKRPEVWEFTRRMCLAYSGQGFRDPDRGEKPGQFHESFVQRFPELRVPALHIHGDLDYDSVQAMGAEIETRQKLPGCRHVVLPDVGHLCNLEEPEAFNRALGAFLETSLG